tara:strand:- start:1795 stop:1962 length:168 start_codon:yes stop_codon:yes gene_type:complete
MPAVSHAFIKSLKSLITAASLVFQYLFDTLIILGSENILITKTNSPTNNIVRPKL